MPKIDHTDAILSLPVDKIDGHVVYRSEEWAIKNHTVLVEDENGMKWMRGNQSRRQAVVSMEKSYKAPFTKLISGRKEQ